MKEFNLKEYLKNNPLLKEEVMVNPIIMFGGEEYIKGVTTSPDDYGFFEEDAEWVKNNIVTAPEMMSIQDYMNVENEWVKQAQIETGGGGDIDHIVDALNLHVEQGLITPEQKEEAMEVVLPSESKKPLNEEIEVDVDLMMGADAKYIGSGKWPFSKFLPLFAKYWRERGLEGGDSDFIAQGLENHVDAGLLTDEEVDEAMDYFWDN